MEQLNLDAEDEKLEITLKGRKYVLSLPEWGALKDIEQKGEDLQSSDIEAFLKGCGLGEETIRICTMKQLQAIYSKLTGVKKS